MVFTIFGNSKKVKKPLDPTEQKLVDLLLILNQRDLEADGSPEIPLDADGAQISAFSDNLKDLKTLELFLTLLTEIETLRRLVDSQADMTSDVLFAGAVEDKIFESFLAIKMKLDEIGIITEFAFDPKVSAAKHRDIVLNEIHKALDLAWQASNAAHNRLKKIEPLILKIENALFNADEDKNVAVLFKRWDNFRNYREVHKVYLNKNTTNFFYRLNITALEKDLSLAQASLRDAIDKNDPAKIKDAVENVQKKENALNLVRLQAEYGPWTGAVQALRKTIAENASAAELNKPVVFKYAILNALWDFFTGSQKRNDYEKLLQQKERLEAQVSELDARVKNQEKVVDTYNASAFANASPFAYIVRYVPDALFTNVNKAFEKKTVEVRSVEPDARVEADVLSTIASAATEATAAVVTFAAEMISPSKPTKPVEDPKVVATRYAQELVESPFKLNDLNKRLRHIYEHGTDEDKQNLSQWISAIHVSVDYKLPIVNNAVRDSSKTPADPGYAFAWLDKADPSNDKVKALKDCFDAENFNGVRAQVQEAYQNQLRTTQTAMDHIWDAIVTITMDNDLEGTLRDFQQKRGDFVLSLIHIFVNGSEEEQANVTKLLNVFLGNNAEERDKVTARVLLGAKVAEKLEAVEEESDKQKIEVESRRLAAIIDEPKNGVKGLNKNAFESYGEILRGLFPGDQRYEKAKAVAPAPAAGNTAMSNAKAASAYLMNLAGSFLTSKPQPPAGFVSSTIK